MQVILKEKDADFILRLLREYLKNVENSFEEAKVIKEKTERSLEKTIADNLETDEQRNAFVTFSRDKIKDAYETCVKGLSETKEKLIKSIELLTLGSENAEK